ncbi:hypothetical protein AYO22_01981 [Fonsecaea multimorphosa]|nr:hypothetical protein AYO22_01981 [Fonsecaea multimorphosa]
MYTLLLITLAATGAFAVPTVKARGGSESGMGMTVAEAGNQCGNGQVVSCCDTSTSSLASGLLSGDLNGILGGSCSPIPLSLVGLPVTQACVGSEAACCTGDQTCAVITL